MCIRDRINVNEYDPKHRLLLNVEAIAYHEGLPGHHLQFSIVQELGDLPPVRKYGLDYNAFTEGWAFYSERLGKDVGFYLDPYSDCLLYTSDAADERSSVD